jgi:superfamily II DNA or RNA helicase
MSVTIREGPLYSHIDSLSMMRDRDMDSFINVLDRALAIRIKGAVFSTKFKENNWDGLFHFFNKGSGKFLSGLLPAVMNIFQKYDVPFNIIKMYRPHLIDAKDADIKLKGIEARPYQIEAAHKCIKQRRGIVYCATNAGKTEIAIMVYKGFATYFPGMGAVLLTHSKEIFSQTVERIISRLGRVPHQINDKGFVKGTLNFTVAMVKSLYTIVNKKIKTQEDKFITSQFCQAEILFFDECHLASSNMWYTLGIRCSAMYRYGLSGTPFLKDDDVRNAKLEALTGPVIYEIKNKKLIKEDYSAHPYVLIDRTLEPNKISENYEEDYNCYIVYNHERNRRIVYHTKRAVAKNKKALVLVKYIEHGEILLNKLKLKLLGKKIEFLHGKVKPEVRQNTIEAFREGKIDVLVSSMILKAGVDVKNISCLILASGGEAEQTVLQAVGRTLRRKEGEDQNVIIIDFEDPYGKYLKRHAKEREKLYQQEKFIITESWEDLSRVVKEPD